jgi:hypothetical protein
VLQNPYWSYKPESGRSTTVTGNINHAPISRNASVPGRPSLGHESSRPIPPPKPVIASDDPCLASLTLGRPSRRAAGAASKGGDWHSGASGNGDSPDAVAMRYGGETQSLSHDQNSNNVEIMQTSMSRLNELSRGLCGPTYILFYDL